ncbi:MAG: Calx-beta domain-containing protein [Pseudomonadales bacterium]
MLLGACGGSGSSSDDQPPASPAPPPVTLEIGAASVAEGDSGASVLSFPVSLPAGVGVVGTVTVDYASSDGTAVAGSDYTAASGTLSIAAGAAEGFIEVDVLGDTELEGDETLTVTLSNPSAPVQLGAMSSATGTIVDDDEPAPVTLSVSDASVTEADANNVTLQFEIALSEALSSDLSFDFRTEAGSATEALDYEATTGGLTIAAGDLAATVEVIVLADDEAEATEDLQLVIESVSDPDVVIGTSGIGSIRDDDRVVVGQGRFLNDTGVMSCSDGSNVDLPCDSAANGTDVLPGQDAQVGLDSDTPNDADGAAGFVFTKLDAAGQPLSDQGVDYAATPWQCVRDEVTGLLWEVKTNDGSAFDKAVRLSHWDTDPMTNGGFTGMPDSKRCQVLDSCTTQALVNLANAQMLCGRNDWRLPSRSELLSIVHYGASAAPYIDGGFFPNTQTDAPYWSASKPSSTSARSLAFSTGSSVVDLLSQSHAVRMVSAGER